MLGFESSVASSLSAAAKLSVTNGVSKVYFLLLTAGPKRRTIFSKSSPDKKKSSGNSISDPHSIQHHHSTTPPVVHQSYIFRLPSVGLTQKRL
jgi:hypothetical protein